LAALVLAAALFPSVVLAQGATSVLTGNVVDTQTTLRFPTWS
jgi:hypothetical protein